MSQPKWPDSHQRSSDFPGPIQTFNYGTLQPPSPSIAAGVYADPQTISLSALAGASIRYTTNGSDPTETSTLYTAPISVTAADTTLKVQAYHPDWSASSIGTHAYQIDAVAPTISAIAVPAPQATWSNTPVTVSFTCGDNIGIASCSAPVTVSSETSGQTVSGTAVDLGGRSTTTNMTVKIDLAPPTVSLTTPTDGTVVSTTTIQVNANVSDAFSGVQRVTCNGVVAAVTAGAIDCTVPLSPGYNAIVVHASDAAGNTFSKSVRVTRVGTATRLVLSPGQRTLVVGESPSLSLTDDFGAIVSGATWTSSDSAIVGVSSDDPPALTALNPGTITINASKNGLQAEASLTVIAGSTLPEGTVRWQLNATPIPGLGTWGMLYPKRLERAVPDMFAVEWNMDFSESTIRAVEATGEVKWSMQIQGKALMTDEFGGVIFGVGPTFSEGLARLAGPTNATPWRYESVGSIKNTAQAPDGTIYAIESRYTGRTNPETELQIISINGKNGVVETRYPVAPEIIATCNSRQERTPTFVGPVIGTDGNAYVLVRQYTSIPTSCTGGNPRTVNRGVALLKFSNAGFLSSDTTWSEQCTSQGPQNTACDFPPVLQQVVPDLIGGMVALWDYKPSTQPMGSFADERHLTRYDETNVKVDRVVATNMNILLMGDAGTAYISTGDVLAPYSAMDVVSWQQKWTLPGYPVMALDAGGVVTHDGTELKVLNEQGVVVSTSPAPYEWAEPFVKDGEWISGDQDFAHIGKPVRSVVGPELMKAVQSFYQAGGNPSGQAAAYVTCKPVMPADGRFLIQDNGQPGLIPDEKSPAPPTIWYWFDGTWQVPERKIQVIAAMDRWTMSNQRQGFNQLQFAEAIAEVSATVVFRNAVPPAGSMGQHETLQKNPTTKRIEKSVIYITPLPQKMSQTPSMYHKAAQHELGHLFGLFENYQFHWLGWLAWSPWIVPTDGSSIMNWASDEADSRGFVASRVTPCDSRSAAAAYSRQP